MDLASSTVMVPSLPTLSMASAMIPPMALSQLAETVATCLISSLSLTFLVILVEVFHGGCHGFLDAALDADRVRARGDKLQAFAINRLGEQRGGGGAVAGVIAGFAGDFADHLGAHVFAGILQFDFLGDGHAVLGHGRASRIFC